MAWKLGGIRIYLNRVDENLEQIIARLQPINSTSTILHVFGSSSEVYNIGGLLVTEADKASLKSFATTGNAYVFSGPEGVIDSFTVKNVKTNRLPITNICLNDRPGLPELTPVYDIQVELFIDD